MTNNTKKILFRAPALSFYKTYVLMSDETVFYIGVTKRTLKKRLAHHMALARSGAEYFISRKIRKLTRENQNISIRELQNFGANRDAAFESEIGLIAEYKNKGVRLANSTPGGDCGPVFYGDKNPSKRPEVRRKISEAKKGKRRPDLSVRNKLQSSKPVKQFDLFGKIIETYPSVLEASRKTGFKHAALYNCLSGRTKTSHGFGWRYV